MTIYTQNYRKWEGEYRKRLYKLWGIIYFGIKRAWSSKWVKICLIFGWIPAIFFIVFSLAFPPFIKELLRNGENIFFANYFSMQILWAVLLTATAGSSLISEDIENKSITLYYASPIKKIDYFLGKFGIIGAFISLITIVPSTFMYWALKLLLSTEIKGSLWIWGACMLNSFVIILFFGVLILFLSSLTGNTKYAGASFFGIFVGSNTIAVIVSELVSNKWWTLLSLSENLNRIAEKIFGVTSKGPIEWYYSFSLIIGTVLLLGVFSYLKLRNLELSE